MIPRTTQLAAISRRLPFVIGCLAMLAAVSPVSPSPSVAADQKPQTVLLTVDYGDGAQLRFKSLPWRAGITVLDALLAAQKHPHGVRVAKRGSGTSAFITQIDDLKNEGNGKNWLFSVNGTISKVGVGTYELKPGDAILWEYKAYEYN